MGRLTGRVGPHEALPGLGLPHGAVLWEEEPQ